VSKAEVESLKQQLEVAQQWVEAVQNEKQGLELEYQQFKQIALDKENDFRGLSDAYNALEQDNVRLEQELKTLRAALQEGGMVSVSPSSAELETAREAGRQEAQKDSEGELNDLLVCLGQEETKVERLRARLEELGEDVEKLLEGIGDQEGEAEDEDVDE
jgi:chromosome segregation ATPase